MLTSFALSTERTFTIRTAHYLLSITSLSNFRLFVVLCFCLSKYCLAIASTLSASLTCRNILFHWIISRIVFTLHLPITLTTSLLLALYTQVVSSQAKKLTRGSTRFLSSLKIPFFVAIGFLFVLEFVITVGTLSLPFLFSTHEYFLSLLSSFSASPSS